MWVETLRGPQVRAGHGLADVGVAVVRGEVHVDVIASGRF